MIANLWRMIMKLLAPFGWIFLYRIKKRLPYKALQRHTYITWRTGSGKSEFLKLMFYSLMNQGGKKRNKSIILIDPHWDIADEILMFDLSKRQKWRIVYIDPLHEWGQVVFNPLEIRGKRTQDIVSVRTEQLVTAIDETVGDAALSVYMKAILTPCISTLLFKGDATLIDLQIFLDDTKNNSLVALGTNNPIPSHARFFASQDFYDKKYLATKTSVKTRLQAMLNYPKFYNLVIGKSTVHLEKEINAGKVIIFRLPPMIGDEAAGVIGRMIIATITGIAKNRSNIEPRKRKPTFLFIDEFQNYVTGSLKIILSQARKRGLHLVLANQHIGQIETGLQRELLANTAIKIAGVNNLDVSKKVISSMRVDPKRFPFLREHDFYMKTNYWKPRKLSPPKILIKPKYYSKLVFDSALLHPYLLTFSDYQKLKSHLYYESWYYQKKVASDQTREEPGQDIKSRSSPKPKFTL